jgi:uncharacterized membrane protein YhaH (DUF805 family)
MNLLFGFSGRIGRGQWWLGQLAIVGVLFLGGMLIVMGAGTSAVDQIAANGSVLLVVLATIVLAVWINLACTVKRFHDRDKSGFWVLIIFVPYIGGIWQIVECGFLSGSPGSNNYGPPPGTGSFSDLEELHETFAEPAIRQSVIAQPIPAQRPSTAAPPRRSVPATGFGRRGLS